ncbi:MAG: hypothetical protein E7672_05840 [Ruminococcaceae bacterium]|nr:hypothetical protein [Oscillospiraceae bacterium]
MVQKTKHWEDIAPFWSEYASYHTNNTRSDIIHISKGLVPFWDDYLINTRFSDVELSVNKPELRDVVFEFDGAEDGENPGYFNIIKEEGFYRMYYGTYVDDTARESYIESKDGIHWERPKLKLYEFRGSYNNNIVAENLLDYFCAYKDINPDCLPEHRYKAIAPTFDLEGYSNKPELTRYGSPVNYGLACITSPDGIHWRKHSFISCDLHFDSLNTLHWNPHTKKYYIFARIILDHPEHSITRPLMEGQGIRGIMVQESEDFVNWSDPVQLNIEGGEDYPMYTNCIMAYPYDTRYYIGFPTRYTQRTEWTANYERLGGKEERLERMKPEPRGGLAITDCVFMSSRDCYNWYRFDEACITPGPENGNNWIYGDGYPVQGCLIETPAPIEGYPNELSILVPINYSVKKKTQLARYTFRRDGFASVKAGYKTRRLLTKQFTFDGDQIKMNFRTSARGYIKIQILDHRGVPFKEGYTTCEIFGDSIDRIIDFEKSLSDLHGKVVSMEITMCDAEIFSLTFGDKEE